MRRVLNANDMRTRVNILCTWVFAVLAVLSLFAFAANPLAQTAGTDSSVFYYIGSGMCDGLVPYRDMFDHKGLLIYFFNWLGALLGVGIVGVWLVESVLFLSMFVGLFRTVRRWSSPFVSLSVCMVYIWLFFRLASGGNMTETYALYFITPTWLLFVDDVFNGVLRNRTLYMTGLAAGAILMLRPNMFAVCVPIAFYLILLNARGRNWREFFVFSGVGFMGILTIVLPCFVYAINHGLVHDMYNCYIQFNMKYSAGLVHDVDGTMAIPIAFLILNIALLFITKNEWRLVLIYNLIFSASSLVLIAMKLQYSHYFLPFLPCIVMPLVALNGLNCRVRSACAAVSVTLCASWTVYSLLATNVDLHAVKEFVLNKKVPASFSVRNKSQVFKSFQYAMPSDASVLVLGNYCEVYRKLNKRTKCRYFYQTVARFSP
jgi:hypothetical protein